MINRILPRIRNSNYYKKIPSVYYIERETGELARELVPAEQWLKWLYYTPFGNLALESVIKRKAFSGFYGRFMKTRRSIFKIKPFVEMFDIELDDYEKPLDQYKSFNDFFIRRIKPSCRPIDSAPDTVVSPADGKLLAYAKIHKDLQFVVKGYNFSIHQFLNNRRLASEYNDGSMFLIRLTPADYHRFHFPVSGNTHKTVTIRGKYYSVSPISVKRKYKTYQKNKREYTIIDSTHFGQVVMAEIGATLVGSIRQNYAPDVNIEKGTEKGYFEFGGSSVVLLFKKGVITVDKDLLINSQLSYETKIKIGERIAAKPIEL